MKKFVLGVGIDDIPAQEALNRVKKSLTPFLIFTPGPEFLVTAQKDPEFKAILNKADLSLPDGFGLKLAGVKNCVPGVDFMLALCQLAARENWTVGLLGGRPGVAKLTASKLVERYPNIKIRYSIDGEEADEVLSDLSHLGRVDLLFVALGHPKQERALANLKFKISNLKFRVGMGVGGSFDFISGVVPEPPAWMSRWGLKWFGRLLYNPKHFPRVVSALIVFPLLLLREKIRPLLMGA